MRRKTIVNDMRATLADDLDALEANVPGFAPVIDVMRKALGVVDRKARRLSAKERGALSKDAIAKGARGAFGRTVRKLDQGVKEHAKRAKPKRARKLGPEE